ncbi:MAG: MBOAT family protein [Anaerolineales bacterium]
MNLASLEFLLLFLPFTLAFYYGAARTARQKTFFLLAASLLFYSLAGWEFLPVLLGLSLATYALARWGRFGWGVWLNLAALILFKYWDFGASNLNQILGATGFPLSLLNLALPLGLSFFIFKHIGYLLDVQQKRYPPSADVWAFLAFSAYFPQISAGPISSYKETAGQFETLPAKLSSEQAASAFIYISAGLAKKILIADTINALMVTPFNSVGGFHGIISAWYLVIAYAMQLYFDFSGYTDFTLGVSQLLGVRLPQNFNSPYLAANPAEFWERWHISLSTWFRVYLFTPLSRFFLRAWGSSKREAAQYAANFATMTLIGLWHGAGWNFILWGAYHGALLNLHAAAKRANRSLPPQVERALFLFLILIGWALFMGNSSAYLVYLLGQMFGAGGLGRAALPTLWASRSALAALFALPLAFSGAAEAHSLQQRIQGNRAALLAMGILAALSILLIEDKFVNPFIYIQF